MNASDIADIYELSPLQHGMLLHSTYDGDADMYVAQRSFRLTGRLDEAALGEAWRQVVAAYPVLRTSFHWDRLDKPLQVVHRTAPAKPVWHDWRSVPAGDREERLARFLAADRLDGFDLAAAPLTRMSLVSFADDEHEFVWTHHMILLDGWSAPIVMRTLLANYRALTAGERTAPPGAPPFRHYIDWLQKQDLPSAEKYWADTLQGAQPTLLSHRTAPEPGAAPVRVAEREVLLADATVAGLRELAARHQVTLNTVFQSAWALLLHRLSGADDILFGCTSSGRPADLPGVDAMVGLLINTLPLRLRAPGRQSVGEWLRTVQERLVEARRYEYIPLSRVKRLAGVRPGDELFGSVVVFDNFPRLVEVDSLSGKLTFNAGSGFEKTSEPLTIMIATAPDTRIRLLHHVDRFAPDDVTAIANHLVTILEHLAKHPDTDDLSAISSLSADEWDQVAAWNETARDFGPGGGLAELLATDVGSRHGIAVVDAQGHEISYGRLWEWSGQVAGWLRSRGVGAGALVGVCCERSVELVVALVGIVRAGAAFVPLDPSFPPERLRLMAHDCELATVLTERDLLGALPSDVELRCLDEPFAPQEAPPAPVAVSGADPAYVLYTSGSTGRPKGVVVSQEAIRNRLLWMQDTFGLGPADRVLQKTPVSFDVSVWEFFWPLMTGATIVLTEPGGHRDSAYLTRLVADHGVTTMHFVPSMLRLFLEEPDVARLEKTALRLVICSGEALPVALKDRCHELLPGVALHNLYGPTEAAVDVTWWDCQDPGPAHTVPIGRPIANTATFVLDDGMRPVPVGMPGELYLGGVQLARGYLNQAGLTAQRFPANPLPIGGSRLYRTGDRARHLPDGTLEYLGRVDRQVKLRGQRIEPGEIDHVLAAHPAVHASVTVLRTDRAPGPYLATYLTAANPAPTDAELRRHLAAHLPPAAVPTTLTTLPALPVTANGKLDHNALPAPAHRQITHRTPPRSPAEVLITTVWQDVLGTRDIGVDDNFFDLGGDSFAAVRAVRRIPGTTVALLLAHPTARELATAVAARIDEDGDLLLPLTPAALAGGRTTPLLVCVPFGGGSAASYLPLARALPEEVDLCAIALPGHEFGGHSRPQPVESVAQACVRELRELRGRPLAVYGHCMGVALATELTRLLEQDGHAVERLFLAGSYPFYQVRTLGVDIIGLLSRDSPKANAKKLRYLKSLGGFDEALDDETAAFVMHNFHHDNIAARRYFTSRWSKPTPAERLRAPITFVAGETDPETPEHPTRYREWTRFSSDVDLAVVHDGGHYFLKHQANELAEILSTRLKHS
ncbi:non-ribosomal peptide synthetase [Actinophytocola sp.]|uniref:non-ribosomal peptide synthetase n=1 Tax=Actinophytocola sp. TaxID=1872138 RepID=UPI003D6A528F